MDLFKIALTVPPLLIAVVVHELAHAYVAYKLGDDTAKKLGRITLNPIKHVDPFLTILVPGILIISGSPIIFGGAKAVPVNINKFKKPKRDFALVALAGPVSNILLAAISIISIKLIEFYKLAELMPLIVGPLVLCLYSSILINIVLTLFNLIPVPPLDGGRIVAGLLPDKISCKYEKLEPIGIFVALGLVLSGVFQKLFASILNYTSKLL